MAYVSNQPFRERALELHERGVAWGEMAGWLGWSRPDRGTDANRLKRTLGVSPSAERRGDAMYTRKHLTEDTALRLCEALGLDPVDVGL